MKSTLFLCSLLLMALIASATEVVPLHESEEIAELEDSSVSEEVETLLATSHTKSQSASFSKSFSSSFSLSKFMSGFMASTSDGSGAISTKSSSSSSSAKINNIVHVLLKAGADCKEFNKDDKAAKKWLEDYYEGKKVEDVDIHNLTCTNPKKRGGGVYAAKVKKNSKKGELVLLSEDSEDSKDAYQADLTFTVKGKTADVLIEANTSFFADAQTSSSFIAALSPKGIEKVLDARLNDSKKRPSKKKKLGIKFGSGKSCSTFTLSKLDDAAKAIADYYTSKNVPDVVVSDVQCEETKAKPTAAPSSGGSSGGDSAAWVKAHNEERCKFGVPDASWSAAPLATATKWAAELAKTGKFEHNQNRDGFGENIAYASYKLTPAAVVKMWNSEYNNYTLATGKCAAGKVCGHWTQVVWSTSTKIGCAIATYTAGTKKGGTVAVCNYDKHGNMNGQPPFNVATAKNTCAKSEEMMALMEVGSSSTVGEISYNVESSDEAALAAADAALAKDPTLLAIDGVTITDVSNGAMALMLSVVLTMAVVMVTLLRA